MENFQRLSRFALLPLASLVVFGFAACSGEEAPGGNSAGSGGTASTAGTASGAPGGAGSNATVGGSAGQTATAGSSSTGGAGASTGGGGASGGSPPGASGSAGAATAGSAGAGGGSGGGSAMGCSGFTGKFCDDFEAQAEGQAPKGEFTVDGPVTVDTSKSYSGTKSIKITKPSPTGQLRFTKQFPVNDLHGRAMFYVSQVPQQGGPHWDLIVAVADTGHNWEIGGMYGKWLFIVDPPDEGVGAGTFPTGKWFCVQWQYKFGGVGQDHTFVAKLDGTVLENGMFTGEDAEGHHWNAGPWENVSIGFTSYGSNVDTEVWVDDIAFGEQEVACPAAK